MPNQRSTFFLQGSALLSALFITAIITIVVTAISKQMQLNIFKIQAQINFDRINLASQVVPFWAMHEIVKNKSPFIVLSSNGKILDFPQKLENIYPQIRIKGGLYDLQAKFNLNNLVEKSYQPLFLNLLKQVTGMELNSAKKIMHAILHWITIFQPGEEGELTAYYLTRTPPYFTSKQPMQHISELRLIKGVNKALFQTLLPYITVLPAITPINISTASKKVLKSLGKNLSSEGLQLLLKSRTKPEIVVRSQIEIILKKLKIPLEQTTLHSQYFLSIAEVTQLDRKNKFTFYRYSLLQRRRSSSGKMKAHILMESINVF